MSCEARETAGRGSIEGRPSPKRWNVYVGYDALGVMEGHLEESDFLHPRRSRSRGYVWL